MTRTLSIEVERFPTAGDFRIARGSVSEAVVVVATLTEGAARGRGECVPYLRYGESVEGVMATIEAAREAVENGADRDQIRRTMKPGAARNSLDCALFDLEAKLTGRRAYEIAGLAGLEPVTTAYTISLGTPAAMGAAAEQAADRPLLKVKLGGPGDAERIAAVRAAAPDSTIIVDANEAWTDAVLLENFRACVRAGVAMIEQPLPAGRDGVLANISRPVPICADESAHLGGDLGAIRARYDMVSIKLHKTGGLTEALSTQHIARELGFSVMVSCMLGSSLAMAPAVILAQTADYVDLDGPLLLARDRKPGLRYEGSTLYPPDPELWG